MNCQTPDARTSLWLPEHVAAITPRAENTIALVRRASIPPVLPGIDLWDMWPLQNADGVTALFGGWAVWFVLSAPALADPDARHNIARIRLMTECDGAWRDCGDALPDGLNPGGREWAGSALYDPAGGVVTLFYTVAGLPGDASPSFAQRVFQTRGRLSVTDGMASIAGWTVPVESFASDNRDYVLVTQNEGVPGFIKGFRDPAHFRDPADGATYLLFTGSHKPSPSAFNGCIGIARADDASLDRWTLMPPLVTADGLNNEQERPHVIQRDGRYYLFWSTQRKVFAPDGPSGPTGLYGMAALAITGPWVPLNGTGLVASNPEEAPYQTYSWWVSDDLSVAGFADLVEVPLNGQIDDAAWRRAHFGATPSPRFHLVLDGTRAIIGPAKE